MSEKFHYSIKLNVFAHEELSPLVENHGSSHICVTSSCASSHLIFQSVMIHLNILL